MGNITQGWGPKCSTYTTLVKDMPTGAFVRRQRENNFRIEKSYSMTKIHVKSARSQNSTQV